MPTKTRSPSWISRAATATISSCGVWSLIAVVRRHRRQPPPHPNRLQVEPAEGGLPVGDPEHPRLQPPAEALRLPRAAGVLSIHRGVTLPEALQRRGMGAARL